MFITYLQDMDSGESNESADDMIFSDLFDQDFWPGSNIRHGGRARENPSSSRPTVGQRLTRERRNLK